MTYLRAGKFGSLILTIFLISQIGQGSFGFFAVDWGTELDPIEAAADDNKDKDPAAAPGCLGVSGDLVVPGPCAAFGVIRWGAWEGAARQKPGSLWPDPTGPPTA